MEIAVEGVPTLSPGDTASLAASGRDARGRPSGSLPADVRWSSTRPDVVEILGPGRIRGGSELGEALVIATLPGGGADSARVWVQPRPEDPSSFRITLRFQDDVPGPWRAALAEAAVRWERVIRGPLPEVDLGSVAEPWGVCRFAEDAGPQPGGTERGVWIAVGIRSGGAGSRIAASGGPCLQRPLPHPTTVVGSVTLNGDLALDPRTPESYRFLATHEMGHALGLVGFVQGVVPPWLNDRLTAYRGPMGLEGFRRTTSRSVTELGISSSFHWPYAGDVMSDRPDYRITELTVGALMDLGYPAAWYGAGPL